MAILVISAELDMFLIGDCNYRVLILKIYLSVSVTLSKVVLGARGGGWGQGRVTRDTLEVNKQIMHDLLDGGVNISHATLLHISAIHA